MQRAPLSLQMVSAFQELEWQQRLLHAAWGGQLSELAPLLLLVGPSLPPSPSSPHAVPLNADDSWLEVTPSQLDQMLSQYSGSGSKEAEPVEGVEQLEAMVSSMKMFMGKVSSHEGAEFPW